MFKLQSPPKYSPFDAVHLLRHFLPLLKTLLELIDFDAFKHFCHFLFHLFYMGKMFPFEDCFHPGKPKKVTGGEIRWIGRVGHRCHAVFGQKLLNTQHGMGRCAHKSPIVKWVNMLKVFKKYSLKPNAASHHSARWSTDTDGFLEHSPSRESLYYKGPALQKIISPHRKNITCTWKLYGVMIKNICYQFRITWGFHTCSVTSRQFTKPSNFLFSCL